MKKYSLISVLCITWMTTTYAQLDPSFGIKGIVKTDIGSIFNYTHSDKQLLLQSDGSMYLVFESAGLTLIAKKLPDGSADTSYGNNGFSVSVPVYESHAAMQANGKIVIAGYTLNSSQYFDRQDFAVARFNTDGSLDNSFAGDGIQVTNFGFNDVANCLTILSDGKIVVAGYSNDGNANIGEYYDYVAVARYNPDGSLDNTFDDDGIAKTDFLGYKAEQANSVAIQSDGKIVIAGQMRNSSNYDFVLARYNTNGSLDITFSNDGMQVTDFGSLDDFARAIAIQSDGKILVAGSSGKNFGIARYNTDGSLDKTFDADGIQTNDFSFGDGSCLAIQNDTKIVVAGSSNTSDVDFVIVRYNNNGSLDNTFNADGKQTTDFGSSNDSVNSIAIQSDGKLLAVGFAISGGNKYIAAARYNFNGTPDISFNKTKILIDSIIQGDTHFTSTAIQSDGKIVAAGYAWNGRNYDFALVRYNTNGSLDNTFSADGKQMTDFGSSDDKARAIAIQRDGKIVVAGSTGKTIGIASYNKDGSLDNTFDGDGLKTMANGTSDSASSIAIQSDGKIVVGGTFLARLNTNGSLDLSFDGDGKITKLFDNNNSFNCNDVAIQKDGKIIAVGNYNPYCIITRYNMDGSIDTTFGNYRGRSEIYAGGDFYSYLIGKSIAIQNDGKIVIGGYYEHRYRGVVSRFFLARINIDGNLDGTFGGGGMVFTSPGSNTLNYGTALAIESDQKIILAGYSYNGSSDDFTLIRYNKDGSLDNSFSGDGIEITPASPAYNRIAGIAIADNILYVAGYGQYPGNLGVVAKYLFASGGALPVTLTGFTAVLQNKSVLLKWQTATEQNLFGFIIERGTDGTTFLPISKVAAAGNSSSKISYSTLDPQPLQGVNFYRLKLVDLNQQFKYSDIISINFSSQVFSLQTFPNPAKNILFVRGSGENEKATLKIIDESGRILKDVKVTLNGSTSFPIYINALPKGIYNLQIQIKAKIETRKFIKE